VYGPGTWVAEGEECYGVAAHSPYGSAILSNGLLHLSSTNGQACPYLASRLPGPVQVFPSSGDFTLRLKMRMDHITWWGTDFWALQVPNTEPVGANSLGPYENILLQISGDGSTGFELYSALSGTYGPIAFIPGGTSCASSSWSASGLRSRFGSMERSFMVLSTVP